MSLVIKNDRSEIVKIFEAIGNHKGYDYAVTLSSTGIRIGYINIPAAISNDEVYDMGFYGNALEFNDAGCDIPNMYANYPPCESDFRWVGFMDISVRDYITTASSFGRIDIGNVACHVEDIKYTQFFVDECKGLIDAIIDKKK